jgi:glycerate-2-kinase
MARGAAAGHPMRAALENNDGHTFFSAIDASIATGPTLTNVNDFRAIYIAGEPYPMRGIAYPMRGTSYHHG